MPITTISSEHSAEMSVHFIDVGQGDSILIQTPENKTILIDGGPPEAGKKLVTYLQNLHIIQIDLLISTHPDMDHIGGLPEVMKSLKVKKIMDSGKVHTTRTYTRYIKQIRKKNIPITIAKRNDEVNIDPKINIKVLNTYEHGKDNNESSIVLKINYEGIDFLLMSDVESGQEKELLEETNVQSTIIKVAHHGSETSSTLNFLKEVNPKVAILTYSKQNDFGHPVNRVIENLNKLNADIYSTAAFGTVVIRTDGKSYFILPEKSPIEGLLESAS